MINGNEAFTVVSATDLGPVKCKRCNQKKPQDSFKELRYYVPVRHGRAVRMLHPFCDGCRTDRKAKWAGLECYDAKVDDYLRRLASRQKGCARPRNIAFLIEPDDVIDLFVLQKGRCALSGIKMMVEEGFVGSKNWFAASIDRIDSKGNYALDNVQLVCAGVNLLKQDMPQAMFIEFCRKVVEHQLLKMDELEKLVG